MVGRPLLGTYLGVRTPGETGTVLLDGMSALVPFILYSSRHSSNVAKFQSSPIVPVKKTYFHSDALVYSYREGWTPSTVSNST